MEPTSTLFEWLLDGAPGATSAPEVVARLALETRAAGIPVDRVAVFVTTLHPNVAGRGFYWQPDAPIRVSELTRERLDSVLVRNSPISEVWRTGTEVRRRLVDVAPEEYPVYHDLVAQGFSDFVALPIVFTSGQTHAITFSTRDPAGFADDHLAILRRILRPLARLTEIFALRRVATNLLDTYVGRGCGERILAGQIGRGDIEAIRAVLWFSDLRGFTELAAQQSPRATIDTLNQLFECQVPAIEARGGEILKFIGDGLLAIFPITREEDAPLRCLAALEAAEAAFAALAARNAAVSPEIRIGVALHVGEIAFGNIGSASRLDFTAIGSAVNLAARLEGLTGKLGRPLVVSQEFAAHTPASRPLERLGEFAVKGIDGAQQVFAPA